MTNSVKPVFSFNLNSKIIDGKVTIGKYDGTHSCLTAATSADKVSIGIQCCLVLLQFFFASLFFQSDNNPQSSSPFCYIK